MLRSSSSKGLVLMGLIFGLCGCEGSTPAPDAVQCQAPALSSAFASGAALSTCEDGACALGADRPDISSEEERDCALAGLKQGLSHGSRHGKHKEEKQCQNDGRVVGQTAAALYCDLSIALGGLGEDELLIPGPESRCSRAFEAACKRDFDRAAKDYARTVGDPSADCTVFTRGEFKVAYEIARHNQCLFSVAEPPPPPPPIDDCADGSCECRDQKRCDLDCQGDDCHVLCERTETCTATCGAECDVTCRDASRCDLKAEAGSTALCERAHDCQITADDGNTTCRDVAKCNVVKDGPGTLLCERSGTCDLTCQGPDCNIVCNHVGKCHARIDQGSVRCDHTGRCEVECAQGKKAKRLRDGRVICEAPAKPTCPPGRRR